ncbi:hypothetical protein NLG97_g7915 [Lecanicillium saksenae]|uniref:Uncharacterized protein n=1 Tax=Lecanicillium saksenae TaxID=468837 RepID=A0ACC1QNE6_9HYPO|nr:hypothetical protein NLG97_g7915 [Lecanicillium saksenae]
MDFPEATVPLNDELRDTMEYYGRAFHKHSLEAGTYFAPVDEEEIERLELMHNVLAKVFDNRLVFPPVASPRRILDCGCGAANWAIDVAELYPDCEVLGIDVSPHMLPDHQPQNLDFQIDDLNASVTSADDADDSGTEPRDQRIGRANRENIKELLATAALYPLTEQRKMPIEEFEELISKARDEAGDPALKVCLHRTKAYHAIDDNDKNDTNTYWRILFEAMKIGDAGRQD